jgi:hypothetical protein
MNILVDDINVEYIDDGNIIKIDTSFKKVISFLKLLKDDRFNGEEKTAIVLRLFLGEQKVTNISIAISNIKNYIFKDNNNKNKSKNKNKEDIINFEIDSDYIYAAMLQVYGIDLVEDDIHWYKFRSLLRGLPSNNMLSEIISIRTREIPKATKYNREERMKIIELKRKFSLGNHSNKNNVKEGLEQLHRMVVNKHE